MAIHETVFGTIGGLGLFLYGMGLLSDGLKMAAGDNLRRLLERITKWPAMAMLVGAGVATLIQSSSATTVIVVGLINAGLLTLKQAIGVILGANVGTTFTAWLVGWVAGLAAFKITTYALPFIGIGFLATVLGKRPKVKHLGQIMLGFGLLFIGIDFLKGAFEPLAASEGVRAALIWMGERPWLGVLAGMLITIALQSSSASVALIQLLAVGGAFGGDMDVALRVVIPFILGDNIGTTVTAQLAAIRANLAGKRAAMAHTLFNVLGVLVVLPFVYLGWYVALVTWVAPWELTGSTIGLFIAVAHTLFNVSAALIMLPLVGLLEAMVVRILPARRKGRITLIEPVVLEMHLLNTPSLAMAQARRELVRMAQMANESVDAAARFLMTGDREMEKLVVRNEPLLDTFQTEITRYLVELSKRRLDPEMANELPVLMHSVNDLERIGDHATNICETAQRKQEQHYDFSEAAQCELERMHLEVHQMFEDVMAAVRDDDRPIGRRALDHERIINQMQVDLRRAHGERLVEGQCNPVVGLSFVDCVDNLEKVGDHLANIAQGVLCGLQWGIMDDELVSSTYIPSREAPTRVEPSHVEAPSDPSPRRAVEQ